jgi:hypothetical protein
VISLVTAFTVFLAGQAMYSSSGVGASLFRTGKTPATMMINCLQKIQIGPSEFRCPPASAG